jgi:predicted nucleotidyltransferase
MPDLHVRNLDEATLDQLRAQAEVHGRSLEDEVRAILEHTARRQEGVLTGEERAQWLRRIKAAVRAVEPDAEVWLFGSQARGDARPESDWDVLILLDGPVDDEREKTLRRRLFDLELEAGEAISALVYARDEWHSEPRRSSSFYGNVHDEAIQL